MPYVHVELRSTFFTACFFLFLIILSPGASRVVLESSEIYEIDYRGPETHSSTPPPAHSNHPKTSLQPHPKQHKVRG